VAVIRLSVRRFVVTATLVPVVVPAAAETRLRDVSRLARTLLGLAIVLTVVKRGQGARSVYVKEVASGARPIEAVGTSVAAFVGVAPSTTP
jgi:hypothetical protein